MTGFDCMGAEVAQPLAAQPLVVQERASQRAPKIDRLRNLSLIFGAGIIGSGGAMAAIWKAHRALGFLLGSVLLGPMVGGVGALIYIAHLKKAEDQSPSSTWSKK